MDSWDRALEALQELQLSGDSGAAYAFQRQTTQCVEEFHHGLEDTLIQLLNGG